MKKPRSQSAAKKSNNPYMKSAFDDTEEYFLTDLGKQFVHYVMNEIVPRIEFTGFEEASRKGDGKAHPLSEVEST
jgi:hypothetical protein